MLFSPVIHFNLRFLLALIIVFLSNLSAIQSSKDLPNIVPTSTAERVTWSADFSSVAHGNLCLALIFDKRQDHVCPQIKENRYVGRNPKGREMSEQYYLPPKRVCRIDRSISICCPAAETICSLFSSHRLLTLTC